jgi:hypothetical protein
MASVPPPPSSTPPVTWIPDDDVAECMACSNKFTMLLRKHHCRLCGRVLCAKCSGKLVTLFNSHTKQNTKVI